MAAGLFTKALTSLIVVIIVLLHNPAVVSAGDNDFVINLLVTADLEGINKWKKATGKTETELKVELNSYVVEVNEIYKSLSRGGSDMTIQFAKPEVVLMNRNILYSSYGIVNVDSAKAWFQRWTQDNQKTFDVAVLLTGYDIESRGLTATAGHANYKSVCRSNGVLVAELSGRFIDPLLLAHEIGHTLSGDHDGTLSATACPASDYYVMSPALIISATNKLFFSTCSYNSFYKFLVTEGRGKECLTDSKDNLVTGPRLGTLMSADNMCQRRYGMRHRVDRAWYSRKGYQNEDVCNQIRCDAYINDPNDPSLPWVATHQGMSCGKGKRCIEGKCKITSDGDQTDLDTCPLGDQTTNLFESTKCSDIKQDNCYHFQVQCCKTCKTVQDTEADRLCLKLQGAASSLVRNRYHEWGDELCQALYCATDFHGDWYYKKHDTPDGFACGKNKQCKNKKCVTVTSGGNPDMRDKCPYGDQPWFPSYNQACRKQIDYYGCGSRWGTYCCDTCYKQLYGN